MQGPRSLWKNMQEFLLKDFAILGKFSNNQVGQNAGDNIPRKKGTFSERGNVTKYV